MLCFTSAINNAGYALCSAPSAIKTNAWVVNTTVGSNVTTYDKDIPAPTGTLTSFGAAIDNNTTPQVVGFSYTNSHTEYDNGNPYTAYTDPEATIWNYGDATATTLNAYAASLGASNLSGWYFTNADSINNNKEVVGYGLLNGVGHCFALLMNNMSGDANGDNKVDINDLTIVLTNYNGTTGMNWSTGDFNGDGKVDINDLTIVLTNYNHSLSSSAAGMAAVPEPGSLLLLMLAAAGLLTFFRRKSR